MLKFGITLSNRGVLLDLYTPRDLLNLADQVENLPLLDSIWVGDALFVNRRLDAMTLLAAIAGRSERVLLGTACMGSFALRDPLTMAYEWASLDNISNGRTRMVACAGGGAGSLWAAEARAVGLDPQQRRQRMIDHIHVLRHLWTKDNESYQSPFYQFEGITLEPKPIQNPCPIWLATNAQRLSHGQANSGGSERALQRVGEIADGWMTHSVSPQGFKNSWQTILSAASDAGREPAVLDNVLYHHININDDEAAAFADSKQFLDLYYGANYSRERLQAWLTFGPVEKCIAELRAFRDSGCRRITFRISTMHDPLEQLRRLNEDVLPWLCER